MLLQAQGNGDSAAGHRLQRLCTELVRPAACLPPADGSLMHAAVSKCHQPDE